ncbi:hypothetical protein DIE22_12015 [Burkholderia sp. Bp9142]|nr:hypothetical protein DIE22_12015 [Burkholderia sp. Bp9142]RQR44895.1 hypothetical protein DIE21_32380 [Burkholderia sp. Bp9140]
MRIPRGALVAKPSFQRFRSASYSSRLVLLSPASEFALLMAEQIKADFARELFDRFHESSDPYAMHE